MQVAPGGAACEGGVFCGVGISQDGEWVEVGVGHRFQSFRVSRLQRQRQRQLQKQVQRQLQPRRTGVSDPHRNRRVDLCGGGGKLVGVVAWGSEAAGGGFAGGFFVEGADAGFERGDPLGR